MEKLWQTIINLPTEEEKISLINKLDPEIIVALRNFKNPYRKPIYKSKNKILAFSFINMPKEYIKQMMMTAMVGFMYKMAIEFQHKSAESLPSEVEGDLGVEISELKKKYIFEKPVAFYENSTTKEDQAKYFLVKKRKFEKLLNDLITPLKNARESADYYKTEEYIMKKNKLEKDEEYFNEEIRICNKEIKNLGIKEENILPDSIGLDFNDECRLREIAKEKLKIKETKEEREEKIQDYVLDFLDHFFHFDPNNHVRTGYMPNYDEKIRNKIKNNPEQFDYDSSGKLIVTDKFEEYLIPPRDTFYSFNNYFDANYEYIRQATDDIYGATGFESAILPYDTFDSEEDYKKWIDKYRKEINATVSDVKMMHWTYTEPFAGNRQNIKTGDDKMRIIDSIIEQTKRDEKLAENIMKKRTKKMKTGTVPFELNKKGIDNVKDLKDESEPSREELEVKVYGSRLKKIGRRFRNVNENFKFNIEAEDSKPKN